MQNNGNPFFEKPAKQPKNWFIIVLQTLVLLTAISIVLYLFVVTPNQVDGPSMEPNFYTGQLLLTNRLAEWIGDTPLGNSLGLNYKRGDVIIFQKPGLSEYVKRVIGLPGDRISIREGYVYVNGQKLTEDYLPPAVFTQGGDFLTDGGESLVVPDGYYFCMGDNRPVSNDSRYQDVGFVDRNWIKGKVILRIWPFDTFGIVSTGSYQLQ